MPVLEQRIEQYVVECAKQSGMVVLKLNNRSSDGWPDRLFVTMKGEHFYIEFKREKGELRRLQEYRVCQLLDRHCVVYIVDNREDGKNVIQHYTRGGVDSTPLPRARREDYDIPIRCGPAPRSGSWED